MKANKGVSMITLIITIIVIIILATIAFVGFDDATDGAQFAKFEQEFGDYAINFESNTVGKIRENNAVDGNVLTTAQMNYEAATKNAAPSGYIIPAGEEFNDLALALNVRFPDQKLLELEETDEDGNVIKKATQCYQITDSNVKGYKDNHEFYGNNLGNEKHYVTQSGAVFTVPGYPREVDGENRMYVTPDLYYVTDESYSDVLTNSISKTGVGTIVNSGAGTGNGTDSNEKEENKDLFSSISIGDYVSYISDVPTNVSWRVWGVNGNEVVIIPTTPVGSLRIGYAATTTVFAEKMNESLAAYKTAENDIKEACKVYTSSALDVTSADIRSLTIGDLEKVDVSELGTQKSAYNVGGTYYNDLKISKSDSYHAARYNETTKENEISSTFIKASKSEPLTVKQTYYKSTAPGWKPLYESSSETYGDLLGSTYGWLPLACVDSTRDGANYLVQCAHSNGLDSVATVSSFGGCNVRTYGVRPLISLNGSKLTVDTTNPGDGSSGAPWNIVKK